MSRLSCFLPALIVLTASAVAASAPLGPLFPLDDAALARKVRLSDATATVLPVNRLSALRVDFGSRSQYPSVRFEAGRVGFADDWSGAGALAITVANAGPQLVPLGLRIDSRAAADRGRQATAEIPPGREVRLVMPLDRAGAVVGMIGQPPRAAAQPGDVNLSPASTPFDPAGVTSFQLFIARPAQTHAVLIKRIELLAGTGPKVPFVDRFGQWNGGEWRDKVHREEEFATRRDTEAAALAKLGALPDRDRFGGWAAGPRLEATGRFRVQKHEGKWWFVDPDGRLFWSSGITCVRFNNGTHVAGRETFFEWLPARGDPLMRFAGGTGSGRTFDFYAANLFRKYGTGFESAFFDMAARRLTAWGVNTIGNWSDERAWALRRVPYTIPVGTGGGASFVVTERVKAGKPWVRRFPDPFDPRFASGLDVKLAALAPLKDDAWLLGVFIDNELPWLEGSPPRGVGAAALDAAAASPVKSALLQQLRTTHRTIASLNAAFGTQFASWDAAAGPWKLGPAQSKSAAAPLAALDAVIAEQYFRTCRDAVRRHLPGTLYLGSRFHVYNREAVQAAKKYCDVVSCNIYGYRPSERLADEWATEMDFPVVIGEFHFGATDRGMFHPGLRKAENQADRAGKYMAYLGEAAAAPWCVGAHWFQYLDQPLTGRNDGENYNIGFINATDDAYPELAAAAREVHAELYRLRSAPAGKRAP